MVENCPPPFFLGGGGGVLVFGHLPPPCHAKSSLHLQLYNLYHSSAHTLAYAENGSDTIAIEILTHQRREM